MCDARNSPFSRSQAGFVTGLIKYVFGVATNTTLIVRKKQQTKPAYIPDLDFPLQTPNSPLVITR